MSKSNLIYLFIVFLALSFTSCDGDDPIDKIPEISDATGLYFINYGSDNATITKFDGDSTVINGYYENQNNTVLNSKGQYFYEYNNKIYIVGNGADQVIVLDSTFVQSTNGITEQIRLPRYCIGDGDFLYISCWGANPDYDKMANSYIAKLDVNTNEVVDTFAVAGGAEGLAIANNKLYVALNYANNIGVIDLSSKAISYLETPASSSYFVKDANDNLYVSLVSTYSNYSESTGIAQINTTSDKIEEINLLSGVSSGYSSILASNIDGSTIYILATSWGEPATIYAFDLVDKTYSTYLTDLNGVNGIFVNPADENIYVFGAESYTEPGFVKVFDTEGNLLNEFDSGVSPYWGLYLNYNEL